MLLSLFCVFFYYLLILFKYSVLLMSSEDSGFTVNKQSNKPSRSADQLEQLQKDKEDTLHPTSHMQQHETDIPETTATDTNNIHETEELHLPLTTPMKQKNCTYPQHF